ncbi:MAG: formylmethanofuran dehydrogenase subunit B [Gemmataceae bacterium]
MTVEGHRVVAAEKACDLAKPWFLGQVGTPDGPLAWVDGQPGPFDVAVNRAVDIVRSAKAPLIYGLSHSSTEAQRAATALADALGANIDTTASTGHAPSILALQQSGESTCTLGEVQQRADLVIYWGSDPDQTHPRHRERYASPRAGRKIFIVDDCESETIHGVEAFIPVTPGCHWEALATLRQLVKGLEPRVPVENSLRMLAKEILACRFGIIFFGAGLTAGAMAHRVVEELLKMVSELNDGRRFYARRMRRSGDVAGADSVLAWQTGYPFGVDFSRGFPRYNPGEFTGPERLARGEPDCCLFIGGATAKDFPPAAREHLSKIPVIVLDSPGEPLIVPATVRFTTAIYGIHRHGTAYRMDEVPIPLRPILPTNLPSDADVLNAILKAWRSSTPGASPIA